jgi:ATP-dependent protease ClpP protease subunit
MKQQKLASKLSFNEEWEDCSSFPVRVTPSNRCSFGIDLFGAIKDPRQFIRAISALEAAEEGDEVVINLSSLGGDLDATDTFLQAMLECRGDVVIRATGGCHSAASIILLAAPSFSLSERFNCLIHCGSIGNGGTLAEYREASKFHLAHMEKILREAYEGFLTEGEIEALLGGKDFWIDSEEFMRRHELRNEYLMVKSLEETQTED